MELPADKRHQKAVRARYAQKRKARIAMAEALEQRTLFTLYAGRLGSPIQPVLDAAGSGDTINLVAGHYVEQLSVSGKNITINGAGQGVTFIDAPTTLSNSFTTSNFASNKAIVSFLNTSNG